MAAEANIPEGKGTVYDHAEYFRLTPDYTPELAEKRGISGQGYAIGRFASDYTYSKLRNRELSPGAVESIVKAAPGNEELQEVGVRFALNHTEATPLEITNFVRAASIMKPAPSAHGNESVNLGSKFCVALIAALRLILQVVAMVLFYGQ